MLKFIFKHNMKIYFILNKYLFYSITKFLKINVLYANYKNRKIGNLPK